MELSKKAEEDSLPCPALLCPSLLRIRPEAKKIVPWTEPEEGTFQVFSKNSLSMTFHRSELIHGEENKMGISLPFFFYTPPPPWGRQGKDEDRRRGREWSGIFVQI